MATLNEIVSEFGGQKLGGEHYIKCPAHDDRTASLSVTESNGTLLFYCHAGCSQAEVAAALKIGGRWARSTNRYSLSPLQRAQRKTHRPATKTRSSPHIQGMPVAYYDYVDEDGAVLHQVVRLEPKGFRQRRPDGEGGWIWSLYRFSDHGKELAVRLVPYRLPELLKAEIVFISEGEKDADTLHDYGFCATTKPMGAGGWPADFNPYFTGKIVYIVPDNDAAGYGYAEEIMRSELRNYTRNKPCGVILDGAKDITEWFEQGHSELDFMRILEWGNDAAL